VVQANVTEGLENVVPGTGLVMVAGTMVTAVYV
jgi:hypothetical protein